MKRFLILLLAICLVACSTAAASKYGYPVDLETMKMLEEQSTFPVRVTEKKVVLENYDVETFSDAGADALVITVTNGSGNEITSLEVGFIAVTEEGKTTDVVRNWDISIGGTPEIKRRVRSDMNLAPGDKTELVARVDYSCFKGVRAMVISCRLADGSVLKNPDYEQWKNYAYGLTSENTTELD